MNSKPQPKHACRKCGKRYWSSSGCWGHERKCLEADKLAKMIAEVPKGNLPGEVIEFLQAKRAPLIAQLAEIDALVEMLGDL